MGANQHTLGGRKDTASDINFETRSRQKAYLAKIIAARKVKLTDIARVAGLAPSTLTRFVNDPDNTTVLSGTTMARIEREFGEGSVGFAESEVQLVPDGMPPQTGTLRPDQHVWRLGNSFMGIPGYLPGDQFLLDMSITPRDGDTVMANIYDVHNGTATTVLRRYQRSWLIGGPDTIPEYADGQRVKIMGVIIQSWRSRQN